MDMDISSDNTGAAMHDTHALPPQFVQDTYFHYNKVSRSELDKDTNVVDFRRGLSDTQAQSLKPSRCIAGHTIAAATKAFIESASGYGTHTTSCDFDDLDDVQVFDHEDFPGLHIVSGLLPPEAQVMFVSEIMHKHLADPRHKNSLEADYHIPWPDLMVSSAESHTTNGHNESLRRSFFSNNPNSPAGPDPSVLSPRNPQTHQPLNAAQFLSKKLRWLTIGSQYHWPTRSYPPRPSLDGTTNGADHPSLKQDPSVPAYAPFPEALDKLVRGIFPNIRPDSGVCLLYGSKDYMPVHRDVSEQCERPLASFSVGCDGVFVLGREDSPTDSVTGSISSGKTVAIRVHSGDCIYLDGEARWAWHAMCRTIPGTCPDYLAEWPARPKNWSPSMGIDGYAYGSTRDQKAYELWRGWMGRKRLNVSCRQVYDD